MSNEIKHFYEFRGYRFSPKEKCLWRNEELLTLSPKALAVLKFLLESSNEVVTRESLLENVWEDTYVDEGNLTVAISHLRKVFAEGEEDSAKFIQTIPKKGYRFVVNVKKVFIEQKEAESVEFNRAAKGESILGKLPVAEPEGKKSTSNWYFAAFALFVVFFLTSFAVWLKYSDGTELSPIPVNERNIKSVAILPFKNLTKGNESLGIGLTDNLISRLGKLNRFVVRPLSSVEKFTESGKDVLSFGKELRVDAVVVGTIQTADNRLRLSVRLLDVRDGAQIWSKNFDETKSDIFVLQDELSLQVTDNLVAKISNEDSKKLTGRETENQDAFAEYSKGQFYLAKRTNKDIEKAIKHFEKAAQLDENYAMAYTGIANGYLLLSGSEFAFGNPLKNAEKIRSALDKSLKLNPNSAEIYSSKASFLTLIEWDIEVSEKNYKKSLSLNPNIAQTHQWYAWNLMAQNRLEEAEKEMKVAQKLDPTSRIIAAEVGLPILYSGRYKESIPLFEQAVEMDENFFPARFRLWYVLHLSKKYDEAFVELEAMKKLTSGDNPFYKILYAITLAESGNRRDAKTIQIEMEKRKSKGEYISPVMLASLCVALNDKENAFKWLNKGVQERNDYLLYLEVVPDYKKLRGNLRFEKLLESVKESKS